MAIFEEQVLEPFVAKGIGNSGVASRQIQAGNLPDLSAAVRQSATTQQNLADQRKNIAISEMIAGNQFKSEARKKSGVADVDSMKPFRIGYSRGGAGSIPQQTVAVPLPDGSFELISLGTDSSSMNKLKSLGVDLYDGNFNAPELGLVGASGTVSKSDLISMISKYSRGGGSSSQIKKLMDRITSFNGEGKSDTRIGPKIPFSFGPSTSDKKWENEQQIKKSAEEKIDLRNRASKIEDPIKRAAALEAIGLSKIIQSTEKYKK